MDKNKDAAKYREAAHDKEREGLPDPTKGGNLWGNNPSDPPEKRTCSDCFAPVLE